MRRVKPSTTALKQAPSHLIDLVQSQWSQALRAPAGRERDLLLHSLVENTDELRAAYPQDSRVHMWTGVVSAGYGRELGGVCGLELLNKAKAALEQAIALNPQDGAAYLYLGFLYESVPEKPYCFGDEALAKQFLSTGLKLTLKSPSAVKQPALA